ncbi:sensor histidine kinase [Bariatricus sp. SGI.019]|uniref:sensor histidine kinase n=1 Tax=Bariatricus sp. SGI.019 TaxID=3420548 RepID=UPI003D06A786
MLSSKLSDASDIEAVLKIAAESISHLLQINVGCIYIGRQSAPIYIQQSGKEQIHRGLPDAEEIRKKYTDLRTPLSGIMGTSEMLMDMTDKEDRRQELLQGIYQDADWLKSLVENILSLTRLQDGKIVIHKEMEAIEEVIGCAVAHVERIFPDRAIQVEIPEEFRLVPMDAKLIEQVITNLLDNAVKHTRPQEAITVSASYTEDELLVSVRDEGEGIAEADVSNLFKIFYASKARSADVKRGIGLGLTICETVINAHGGTITGRNRTDRKGAEFLFTLPLTEGESEIV